MPDSGQHVEDCSDGTATNSRRDRTRKSSAKEDKFEALKRARAAGQNHKYETKAVLPVYDYVDEDEYSKIVQQRQEENWIVPTSEDDRRYLDDGREIFDDDDDDEPSAIKKKAGKSTKSKGKAAKDPESEKKPKERYGDIRSMLASASLKQKPKDLTEMTPRNNILVENLIDELMGNGPKEKEEPNRLKLLFPDRDSISSYNSSKSQGVTKLSQKQNKKDLTSHFERNCRSPAEFLFADQSPLDQSVDDNVSEVVPVEKPGKRVYKESPVKPAAAIPVRESVLASKISSFSLDGYQGRNGSKSTVCAGTKKLKPGTPIKKITSELDHEDLGSEFFSGLDGDDEGFNDMVASMDMGGDENDTNESRLKLPYPNWECMASESLELEADCILPDSGDDQDLKFYWLDAYEEHNLPGCVFLFGKTAGSVDGMRQFVSTCIKVSNIERRLYLLLRPCRYDPHEKVDTDELVDYSAVEAEFRDRIAPQLKISKLSMRTRATNKRYYSKAELPGESPYLEVRYPFSSPALPEDLEGETFSRVFGRTTTALEILLLDRRLKGPAWLSLVKFEEVKSKVSICKRELVLSDYRNISVISNTTTDGATITPPPVGIMCIHLAIIVNSETKQNEIVAAGILRHDRFSLEKAVVGHHTQSYVIISESSKSRKNQQMVECRFPYGIQAVKDSVKVLQAKKGIRTDVVDTERRLLIRLFDEIRCVDPDFLIFHGAFGYQMDVLLHRAESLRVPNWSGLGRLKRHSMPKKGRFQGHTVTAGRLVCDVRQSAQELVHCQSYGFTDLVKETLGLDRQEMDSDVIRAMYRTMPRILEFVQATSYDAFLVCRLMTHLDTLPLALQITNIAGNLLVKDVFKRKQTNVRTITEKKVSKEFLAAFHKLPLLSDLCTTLVKQQADIFLFDYKVSGTNAEENVSRPIQKIRRPSGTLTAGRAKRNEFLLLHAFFDKGYICPDQQVKVHGTKTASDQGKPKNAPESEDLTEEAAEGEVEHDEEVVADPGENAPQAHHAAATPGKRKPAYAGGLVLEPQKGLHTAFTLLMDFNSLYPSIIQEYNICFTTIGLSDESAALPDLPDNGEERGVLPAEMNRLIQNRKAVKQLLKEEKEKRPNSEKLKQYDIRQKALKLTANSMYGCLGFANSRFFARPLAALITAKGREILTNTKDLVEKLGFEVIYGDTDSIMINTRLEVTYGDADTAASRLQKYDEVVQRGREIKTKVGKAYTHLELEVDGIFARLLMLQKKKYAALIVSKHGKSLVEQTEMKGLDVVRRDWSLLAKQAGEYVVNQILCIQPPESMIENIQGKLRAIGEMVDSAQISSESDVKPFGIMKQLAKDPGSYTNAKGLPHVQAALRWNAISKNARQLSAGDTVNYVVCNEIPADVVAAPNQKVPHTQRGYYFEEVLRSEGKLTIDKQYYLAEQVHRVVNRLCEHVPGIDAVIIAECLGVDKNQFPHHFQNVSDEEEHTAATVGDHDLYKNCLPLTIPCPGNDCRTTWIFDDPIWEKDGRHTLSLEKCPECPEIPMNHAMKIRSILQNQIRLHMQQYYKVRFVCEDSHCQFQCSFVPPKFRKGRPVCPACDASVLKPEYSDRDLYLQLCYWKNVFDPERAIEKFKIKDMKGPLLASLAQGEMKVVYHELANFVRGYLDKSSYGEVKMSDFFCPPGSYGRPIKLEF